MKIDHSTTRIHRHTSDRLISIVLIICVGVLSLVIYHRVYSAIVVHTPDTGGVFSEGVLGIPRSFNPIFAQNQAEQDIAYLIHSGLTRYNPNTDRFDLDLAQSYTSLEDGKTHSFVLKENIYFNDGTPITRDDVIYTLIFIQQTKNRYRDFWFDVKVSRSETNPNEIFFTKPIQTDITNQSTFPILPSHIWQKIPFKDAREYKNSSVFTGSGMYRVEKNASDINGISRKIHLTPFEQYHGKKPYINLTLSFYQAIPLLIDAFTLGEIDALSGVSPIELENLTRDRDDIVSYALDTGRVFSLFFNTNDDVLFSDPFLRSIFASSFDKEDIVKQAFGNSAKPLYGPLSTEHNPVSILDNSEVGLEETSQLLETYFTAKHNGEEHSQNTNASEEEIESERVNTLDPITIVIPNIEEVKRVVSRIRDIWDRIHIKSNVLLIEPERYTLETIAQKQFDIVFYGYDATKPKDLFSYWNSEVSGGISDITGYGNISLNETLKKLYTNRDDIDTDLLYTEIKKELRKDVPAIFFYSPDFIYIIPSRIRSTEKRIISGIIKKPHHRYHAIHNWFINHSKTLQT